MPSSPPEPSSPTEQPAPPPKQNGSQRTPSPSKPADAHPPDAREADAGSDPSARLEAMQQDRDNLRNEVSQMRQALEQLRTDHTDELSNVRDELSQTQHGKEVAENQYRVLLEKVNTIRSQLGERLKADAAELEQARGRIEDLESERDTAQEENERLQGSISDLSRQTESQASEIDSLRSRTSLSTSNWAKERDDLLAREAYVREELEVAKQAMQDWEILATEERSRREAQDERVQELEERMDTQRQAYERVKNEAETQSSTVDGLQRALRDLQDERKRELREMVEQSQAQLDDLRKQSQAAEERAAELGQKLGATQKELERALPFEKEVKEKNLLIGKLRHEAVILNDHLTKALRFLKRGRPEDNVDRQLVTNHFMQFLALDRSDPKKFQVLQLIAALLGWDEQQKEQAGLLRQGSGTGALRVPASPFRRTPSTPSLGEFVPESPSSATRESLAELWSEFLEREAESGGAGSSRRGSVAQSVRSGSFGGLMSPTLGRTVSESRKRDSPVGETIRE